MQLEQLISMLEQIVPNRCSSIIDNIISLQSGSEGLTYELLAGRRNISFITKLLFKT